MFSPSFVCVLSQCLIDCYQVAIWTVFLHLHPSGEHSSEHCVPDIYPTLPLAVCACDKLASSPLLVSNVLHQSGVLSSSFLLDLSIQLLQSLLAWLSPSLPSNWVQQHRWSG